MMTGRHLGVRKLYNAHASVASSVVKYDRNKTMLNADDRMIACIIAYLSNFIMNFILQLCNIEHW